ncbi:MAG TPA: twin-arginine translocase TatA/TatE family subunit [Nitrospirae bacterium]|nr:sec-independent protein translocase protein TatAd [bacterium BMS3Bbin08]HDH51686.1 twin-arginine translocase TatA/TatE family subunit [Nitrospirota bacterium]HDK17331.1 twin-arginine translocase TatA/TatE family subunit [Nitrospirota bacterium]
MFGLGVTELIVILVIVVVLFGASRLPQIGKGIGEGIKNFKKSTSGLSGINETLKSSTEETGNNKGKKT